MARTHPLKVPAAEEGQRLDRLLNKVLLPHTPFALLQKWLRSGQVRLNGKRAKPSARVQAGDAIRLPPFATLPEPQQSPMSIEALIVAETPHYLLLSKPAGLACQGGRGITHSLDAALKARSSDAQQPRLVHRLDQATSGLMLVAQTRDAAARLARLFASGGVRKLYCALVSPATLEPHGARESMLEKNKGKPQAAHTRWHRIERCGEHDLLALRPISGRKHQLRRHMAELGTPILGDRIYGAKTPSRLMLHALRIVIAEAEGGEDFTLDAHLPPPAPFLSLCARLNLPSSALLDPTFDPFERAPSASARQERRT